MKLLEWFFGSQSGFFFCGGTLMASVSCAVAGNIVMSLIYLLLSIWLFKVSKDIENDERAKSKK